MATARLVINTALRKLGVLAAGREARTPDATDALAALQGLYGSWVSAGAFGRLRDVVPQGTAYTAFGGERIYRRGPNPLSVTLPELVSSDCVEDYGRHRSGYYGTVITVSTAPDGATVIDVEAAQPIGYVQPPRDGACVVISDEVSGQTATWLYDGSVKRWQGLHLLQMDNEAPRSASDFLGLASCLATEIADTYGDAAVVGPSTVQQANRYKIAMTQRFGFERQPVPGVFC